jgi:endonuclease/exonuclease/phosphatase family metal-dependent hydrolase
MARIIHRARTSSRVAVSAAVALLLWVVACTGDVDFEIRRSRAPQPELDGAAGAAAWTGRPSSAAPLADEIALLTWNIEWFQDAERGPGDDARQFEAALEVLAQARPSLAGLQEISVPARLHELIDRLPGYALVTTDYEWPQQTALLYHREQFEPLAVQTITGLDDAGRPPLQVELAGRDGSALTVIVVHAKAGANLASWERRERFAVGLKQHLDARATDVPVIVLGDFNDGFARSIVAGQPSPYAPLIAASGYAVPTAALEDGPEPSTVWGDTVDHVLLSEDLAALVVAGSVDVLRDELLARAPQFFEQVSDHIPVVLRLRLPRR